MISVRSVYSTIDSNIQRPMRKKFDLIHFAATGAYSGSAPWMPGTFGSLAVLPLCFVFSFLPILPAIVVLVLFIVAAIYIAGQEEKNLQRTDPGAIVIDEWAGMLVTFFAVEWSLTTALAGFVLFRIFDILKPYPIRRIEGLLKGGVGVVADDLVAGFMANVVLRVVLLIAPGLFFE